MAPRSFPFDLESLASALAPLISRHITNAITSALTKQDEELLAKLDELIKVNATLSSSIISANRIQPCEPDISESRLYSTVARMVRTDATVLQEKAIRAVFIGVPHAKTKDSSAKEDYAMVAEVVRESNNRELLEAFESGTISTQLHPSYEVPQRRSRPLKVCFPSKSLRDEFINYVRFNKPSKIKELPHCHIRHDYTQQELSEDRRQRQQAGLMNAQTNQLEYVVRDLRIVKLKSPRVLPKRVSLPNISDDTSGNVSTNISSPPVFKLSSVASSSDRSGSSLHLPL
ncbi:hypothetical protein AB6A40_004712 [Gnathostoma spinigerum]|uniref:Uncharacterized protein n=1 Tax=Gnathostoma spinigerum TaxID=75299 RepID=A0ABD6EDG0_9BILA